MEAALPQCAACALGLPAIHFLASGVSRSRLSWKLIDSKEGPGYCSSPSRPRDQGSRATRGAHAQLSAWLQTRPRFSRLLSHPQSFQRRTPHLGHPPVPPPHPRHARPTLPPAPRPASPSAQPARALVGNRSNGAGKSPPSGAAPLSPTFPAPAPSAPPTTFPHLDAAHILWPRRDPIGQVCDLILAV